jgi:general secretion pathway protein D
MKQLKLSHRARIGAIAFIVACLPAFAQEDAPRRGEPITLNFTNAEIEAVARTMAVVTGRDVVVDPRVKGTLTLQTDRAIAPEAAFNQFASALRMQGFAVVPSDGLYKIVPEADAKLQGTAVGTATPAPEVAGNQIVTQVFRLNYESANTILPVLRPLIAPNNAINVNPGNNSLVITDYAENMRRLARIIAALDVPNASDIEVIPLKHSVATELAPLVARLIEGGSSVGLGAGVTPGATPGTSDASFRTALLAEPRSNALIVRAANPARVQLVRALVEKLDRPAADGGNGAAGNVHVIYLKNADAVRLAVTLRAALAAEMIGTQQGMLGGAQAGALGSTPQIGGGAAAFQPLQQTGMMQSDLSSQSSQATAPLNNANQPSTGGQIQADPATNSLIITAPEPQFRQIRAVIDRLDGRRAQVLVESLIVEVNADKAAEFGIQWQAGLGSNGDRNVGIIGTNSNVGGTNIINLALGIASGALGGAAGGAAGALGAAAALPSAGMNFGVAHRYGNNYVLGFLARFFENNGEGNVLSTPNLLTLDNEEAKIVIGQNVPFVTGQFTNTGAASGSVNPFQTIERKDVGLTLRVRPTINENGTVKLQVFQEVSSVDPVSLNSPNGPITNKRSIESSVLVEDGSIVVLGGLLQDTYSKTNEKVPLLGDVPVLGNLFRSEARSRQKTNLMVFLRPVVVRDAAASSQLAMDRYDALRVMQQGVQPEQTMMLRNVDESAVLPPLPQLPPARNTDRRIEGTRLVPPPMTLDDTSPARAPAARLEGAPPPTDDPATWRTMN